MRSDSQVMGIGDERDTDQTLCSSIGSCVWFCGLILVWLVLNELFIFVVLNVIYYQKVMIFHSAIINMDGTKQWGWGWQINTESIH